MSSLRQSCPLAAWILLLAGGLLLAHCGKDKKTPSQPKDPACGITPGQLHFGHVPVDSSAVLSFTISNTGGGTLTGAVADSCGRFYAITGGGAYSLGAGQSRIVSVRFVPLTEDSVTCGLQLGNTGCPGIICTGKGVGGPACAILPARLDFGTVAVGGSREMSFTIGNSGRGVLSGLVELVSCPEFSLVSGGGSFAIHRGTSIAVRVRLTPLAPGEKSCVCNIGSLLCAQVQCSGTGETPPPDLVLIPAGGFNMGSPLNEPGRFEQEPPHPVQLTKAIYVGKHEVTQTEWLSLMGWNDSSSPSDSLPVDSITWFDAIKFCNNRSAREGKSSFYNITGVTMDGDHIVDAQVTANTGADGYRLLTDAEWEYVCRAGTSTAFYTGEITQSADNCDHDPALDLAGWYCANADRSTHEVMKKQTNGFGLYDTHGNVWEWCWDWWEISPSGMVDPTGPATGTQRTARGGAVEFTARYCRSAYRTGVYPYFNDTDLGLRIARTAQ